MAPPLLLTPNPASCQSARRRGLLTLRRHVDTTRTGGQAELVRQRVPAAHEDAVALGRGVADVEAARV